VRPKLRTTNASETAKRMCPAGLPSGLMARTSSRNGGFTPDSSASELPALKQQRC